MEITKALNQRFENFVFDWDYQTYLLVGGYGSSKSYHTALKIIIKCFEERRKVIVVREVYETIRESCFDLILEILNEMGLLEETLRKHPYKVTYKTSPLQFAFPNGSKIIFKGMDKPGKLKSMHGVSIVWLEEAAEIKYAGYKELLGRLRHPTLTLHFILTTNPVGVESWIYQHFFIRTDPDGKETTILDDKRLYERKTLVKNGVYYHHSVADDNVYLPKAYIKTLDEMQGYDPDLYRIARLGFFGISGKRVLPQFTVAKKHADVMKAVREIHNDYKFVGMDFGFEISYNAVLKMAVDHKNKWLYIYWEYYKNHMTDDETAAELKEHRLDEYEITADSSEPKTIQYLRQSGFTIRGCRKFKGSRLANTKKVKRFKKIICSPNCKNTIRELSTLTYKKDTRDNFIYDEFNVDAHTFSAIWYGLDNYTVADIKEQSRNSRRGS